MSYFITRVIIITLGKSDTGARSWVTSAAIAAPKLPHAVFISYSNEDKNIVDAVCAALEAEAIRCWIAPLEEAESSFAFSREVWPPQGVAVTPQPG